MFGIRLYTASYILVHGLVKSASCDQKLTILKKKTKKNRKENKQTNKQTNLKP